MSGHGDHDEAHGDDDHDHDDHHAAPALEEPATPLWLTLLGIGLFLCAGILFVATRADGKTTAELTAAPSDEAEPAAAPPGAAAARPNPGVAAPNRGGTPPSPAMVRPNAPPNPPGSPPPRRRPMPPRPAP